MPIREATPDDAEAVDALNRRLDEETTFMLFEPGERTTTLEQMGERLRSLAQSDHRALLLLEQDEEIVGFVLVLGDRRKQVRHRGYIVIGVVQAHCGRGHGRALMEAAEAWAREHDMTRLTLTVMAHNERAIKLYERVGFEREGLLRRSLRVDGEYVDEIAMGKLLE
ncbi:MAG: GNAT family protein [Planctomycetota bacterium]|nr:GNAT family protein [Planctomycetota bacterium]